VPRQPPHLQKFLRNSGIRPYWHPQVQYEAPPAHPTVQEANTGKSPQLASFRSKTPRNRITRDHPGSARPPPSTALAGFSISRSLHRTRLPAGRAAAIRDSPPGAGRTAPRPQPAGLSRQLQARNCRKPASRSHHRRNQAGGRRPLDASPLPLEVSLPQKQR